MKVSDIMSKDVEYVFVDTPIKEVTRLIFGRGINGVPVCMNKKIVGFITERDILDKFLPSMQEYIEDPIHSSNFEEMEEKSSQIFELSAKTIMSKNPTLISQNAPVLQAHSLMTIRKVGRLPVVDEKNNLVGMISKGDIFRVLIGRKLPFEEEESFFDWLARYYDLTLDWKRRLSKEIPDLVWLFKKQKAKKILDVGAGTGEHAIALAKKGFNAVGIEASQIMYEISSKKVNTLGKSSVDGVKFIKGVYKEVLGRLKTDFDASIFLGNSFPHIIPNNKDILKDVAKVLAPKGLMIFQIVNFEKMFKARNGLREFSIGKSRMSYEHGHAFLGFYSKGKNDVITYTKVIFDCDQDKWVFRGIKSTLVLDIGKMKITEMLKDVGFSNISFFGSRFNEALFKDPFNTTDSDWLNIIATR